MGIGMGPSQGRRVTLRHRCGSEASPLPTGTPRMHAFVSRPRPPMCTRVTRSAAYNAMYPGRLSTVCCPSEAPAMPLTTRPWKKPLEHSTCRAGQVRTPRGDRAGHHVATGQGRTPRGGQGRAGQGRAPRGDKTRRHDGTARQDTGQDSFERGCSFAAESESLCSEHTRKVPLKAHLLFAILADLLRPPATACTRAACWQVRG